MSVKIDRLSDFCGYGAAMRISNGLIEAVSSVDCGPRVLRFGLVGGENLFWVDTDGSGRGVMPGLEEAFGKGKEYSIMGGHRLWASPEHAVNSYYPDSDPVEVAQHADGLTLTPPVQYRLDLRLSFELRMSPDAPRVTVIHKIENTARRPVKLAAWALTQLAQGGLLVFPQSKADTGLLADRHFAVWPYTDMGDARLRFADDYISITQDPSVARSLKIGTFNRRGVALYLCGGAVFRKTWTPLEGEEYPDGGCCFESYTDRRFIEMESLSPLRTLGPGESVVHEEVWEAFAQPEKLDAAQLLAKYGN